MINIRNKTATILKQNFNIDPSLTEMLFDVGLIRDDIARRFVIREEYLAKSRSLRKTDLKISLAQKYCVSFSTVEKIVSEPTL